MISGVNLFHNLDFLYLYIIILIIIISIIQWFLDIIFERRIQGFHNYNVLNGIKFGIVLFIISEIIFFFRFFWSYLHIYLSPNIDYGTNWPPVNIIIFNPYDVPLLNTIILLSSGVTITLRHYYLILNFLKKRIICISITILLGVIFSLFQLIEYNEAIFSISDSIYGSLFFIITGFHGLHVLIGTVFLIINLFLIINFDYSFNHHFGFEAAAWYWHFVDVVWLFLFIIVYYWPY